MLLQVCGIIKSIPYIQIYKLYFCFAVSTTRIPVEADSNTCGADSFMMRDGVCDEAANNARCLYDGGDCCKEFKDKTLCRDCECIKKVDEENLRRQFDDLQVKPVEDPGRLASAIGSNGWIVEVEEVVSVKVCAEVCLEHEKAALLNAWHYLANARICRCGWVHSAHCPEKMAKASWTQDKNLSHYNAYVQLEKTVSCGMGFDNKYVVCFTLNKL